MLIQAYDCPDVRHRTFLICLKYDWLAIKASNLCAIYIIWFNKAIFFAFILVKNI